MAAESRDAAYPSKFGHPNPDALQDVRLCEGGATSPSREAPQAETATSVRGGRTEVAALYVETGGAYFGLAGVDPWDERRDARGYWGPHPVVAHPPCNKWSPLAFINAKRLPNYKVGDDDGCFEHALYDVRRWGGVLEHPATTLAWKAHGLPKPQRGSWQPTECGGWVTEVDQGRYGHRARKRTWLYAHGVPEPPALDWRIAMSDMIVSGFTHQPKGEHVACEHRRVRPAEASRTTDAFREVLLAIARSVYEVRTVAA